MDYSRHNTEKQRRLIRSAAAKIERKVGFNVLRFSTIAVVILIAIGIAALVGGFRGIIDSAPEISANQIMPNKFKSVMYYPDGTEAIELVGAQSNRTIVRIEDLPSAVPEAFIAIEDERFYEHNGIDPRRIIRAMFVGLGSGNFSEGASTITQQLIKITVFNGGNETDILERFTR
jgi:penicillin-binding protein 1A